MANEEKMSKYKVSEEIALDEVKRLAEYHLERELDKEDVKKDYPDVIEAVKFGLLVIDDEQAPRLTLRKPILNDEGGVSFADVSFRTRIRPSEKEKITKGLDLAKEQLKMINQYKAFLIKLPSAMLDKFDSKADERTIDQICSLFM